MDVAADPVLRCDPPKTRSSRSLEKYPLSASPLNLGATASRVEPISRSRAKSRFGPWAHDHNLNGTVYIRLSVVRPPLRQKIIIDAYSSRSATCPQPKKNRCIIKIKNGPKLPDSDQRVSRNPRVVQEYCSVETMASLGEMSLPNSHQGNFVGHEYQVPI